MTKVKQRTNAKLVNLGDAMSNWANNANAIANLQNEMADVSNGYMDSATSSQALANAYNHNEAQLQRDWTQAMSSTAHQREVADLKAAGLNPVLSANVGAPMGSGASASTSDNLTNAFGNMANSALKAVSDLAQANAQNSTTIASSAMQQHSSFYGSDVNAYAAKLASATNLSMNAATNAMNYKIAQLQSLTSQQVAQIAGQYNLSSSQVSAIANQYSAQLAYASSRYGTDVNARTVLSKTEMDNATSRYNTDTSAIAGVIGSLVGLIGRR